VPGALDLKNADFRAALEGFAFATAGEIDAYAVRVEEAARRGLAESAAALSAAQDPAAYKSAEARFAQSAGLLHGLQKSLGETGPTAERLALGGVLKAGRGAASVDAFTTEEADKTEADYRAGWTKGRWLWERNAVQPFGLWEAETQAPGVETPAAAVVDLYDVTGVLAAPADRPLDGERRNLLDRLAAALEAADGLPTEQAKRVALAGMHVRWLGTASPADALAALEERLRNTGRGRLTGLLRRLAPRFKGETGGVIDTRRVYREVSAGSTALLQIVTDDLARWLRLSDEEQRRSALRIAFLEILKDGFRIVRPLDELERAFRDQKLLDIQA
jgi:hypothetical protein